ncbi:MAG: glycosyltransferase [Saprospiraceae bacterium]|nr:glycosyltransferase [Saprospiraceae bacterium]
MDQRQILSIIILSYESEKNIESITRKVIHTMKEENIPFEIIIMDDGSKDQSYRIAQNLSASNDNIKTFQLSKNFNSPYAMFAGLSMSRGACAVVIPDDLQRPLHTVVAQYRKWQEGAKIVIAYRASREDGILSDLFSSFYYFIMNTFSKVNFPPGGAHGFLADREVVDILVNRISHKNTSPIIEVLQLGFDPVFIPFDRPKSTTESRWTLKKKISLAMNTFFASSTFPVKLVTFFGFCMFSIAFIVSLFVIYAKIFTDNTLFGFPVPGWATIILVTMFFNGMTMLSLGIIAEYIWRIFEEVKGRPPYIIRNKNEES